MRSMLYLGPLAFLSEAMRPTCNEAEANSHEAEAKAEAKTVEAKAEAEAGFFGLEVEARSRP